MFGIERFKNDIVFGDKCFICGADPKSKAFNGEHILSDWILREFGLHRRQITLPNLTGFKYSEYRIPCCKDCNSLMGNYFEVPISEAAKGGMKTFAPFCKKVGFNYIFNWLALTFIKTHLKDAQLRAERDRRKGDDSIGGKYYEFETLHHVHCIARSFFTKAKWEPNVTGSLYIGPAKVFDGIESFDFADNYLAKTILLRMHDFFLLAVFNDSGGAMSHMNPNYLSKITEGLTLLQMRELFVRFSHCNLSIESRPTFHSGFDSKAHYEITVKRPADLTFKEFDGRMFGEMMWHFCGPTLNALGGVSPEQERLIKQGIVSYILDEKRIFKTDSIVIVKS